jgi:hypothetical protein
MLVKTGVDISRLRPEIRKKLTRIASFYQVLKEEMVITSTYEGNHSEGSLHYANLAVDIRRPGTGSGNFEETLKSYLGKNYDIVYKLDHIHIEYDPK